MSWFTQLHFSPVAHEIVCIMEAHLQMQLVSPPDINRARLALNDGRLYQYMRIMHPHWTSYKLEILLLTAAAMNVGAHLNFKFWSTLGLICALNENPERNFCDLRTTRMLAFARSLYENTKRGTKGGAFDFQILARFGELGSAGEILATQRAGADVSATLPPWPKDDIDDPTTSARELGKLAIPEASVTEMLTGTERIENSTWQAEPSVRADYWNGIEAANQGLPEHPDRIILADIPLRPKALREDVQHTSQHVDIDEQSEEEYEEDGQKSQVDTTSESGETKGKKTRKARLASSKVRKRRATSPLKTTRAKSKKAKLESAGGCAATPETPAARKRTTKAKRTKRAMTVKNEAAATPVVIKKAPQKPLGRTRAVTRTQNNDPETPEPVLPTRKRLVKGCKPRPLDLSAAARPLEFSPTNSPNDTIRVRAGVDEAEPTSQQEVKPTTPKLAMWQTSPAQLRSLAASAAFDQDLALAASLTALSTSRRATVDVGHEARNEPTSLDTSPAVSAYQPPGTVNYGVPGDSGVCGSENLGARRGGLQLLLEGSEAPAHASGNGEDDGDETEVEEEIARLQASVLPELEKKCQQEYEESALRSTGFVGEPLGLARSLALVREVESSDQAENGLGLGETSLLSAKDGVAAEHSKGIKGSEEGGIPEEASETKDGDIA